MDKKIIKNAATICNNVAQSINLKNSGQPCKHSCPGRDKFINAVNQLMIEIKDIEPECFQRLMCEMQNISEPYGSCVHPFQFGAVNAITDILYNKYINVKKENKKIFISHSSNDKTIINGFVKEILKVGCGFKSDDIFCTLDTSSIRTGDDFREKIVENMKDCDFILLFISDSYNKSDVCKNEMGAAWALDNKRVLPFTLPKIEFDQMGFLNVVKQGASITDGIKLDELYDELCSFYELTPDWRNFNKAKADFFDLVKNNG